MSPREAAGTRAAPVLLGALVGSLVAGRLESAALCIALGALAAAAAGASWPGRPWWRNVALGAAIAIVLNALLVRGTAVPLPFPLPFGLHVTWEGLALGTLLAARLAGAAVAFHGLRAAWPGERAADEGARLLRPLERLRVPVSEARLVLGLALRFAPLLAAEARRIAAVQDLRAGRPPRGWAERLARRRAVLIPALVGSLERAERVALALEARHYRVRPPAPRPRAAWGWSAAGVAIAGAAWLWRG